MKVSAAQLKSIIQFEIKKVLKESPSSNNQSWFSDFKNLFNEACADAVAEAYDLDANELLSKITDARNAVKELGAAASEMVGEPVQIKQLCRDAVVNAIVSNYNLDSAKVNKELDKVIWQRMSGDGGDYGLYNSLSYITREMLGLL